MPQQKENSKEDSIWRKKAAFFLGGAFVVGILGGILGSNISNGNIRTNIGPGSRTYKVEEQSQVIEVVKKVGPSVVSITVQGSQQSLFGTIQTKSAGTGFIVESNGLIVTNKHVVSDKNAQYNVLTSDGREYKAEVKAEDSLNDVAFLKIDAKDLPVTELGNSDELQVGQSVVAIGNTLGQYQNTVTTGVISGVGRAVEAGDSQGTTTETLENVIQTDAAINPGNSGGPLVNIGGQVIGINTAIDQQGQLIGFAIPINMIKKQIESVKVSGKIERPILGVRYIPITKELAARSDLKVDRGVLVYGGGDLAVVPGSPAANAGIKEGDIILKINDDTIDRTHSLSGILQKFSPGDRVTLTLFKNNGEEKVDVTLGKSDK